MGKAYIEVQAPVFKELSRTIANKSRKLISK